MQSKDIPDLPVLAFIAAHGGIGCNWFKIDPDIEAGPPPETPDALVLAKMRRLIRRGLVDGCSCGCRGDFELTDKGRALLA